MSDERRQKLEARLAWLETSVTGLRRNFARMPWIATLLLLIVPAAIWGGGLWAFYVAFMVGTLISVSVYISWSHLHENEIEFKTVRSELRKLDAADAAKIPPTA